MRGRDWYYKASYDKANRTASVGKRGPGLDRGIEFMKNIKLAIPDIKLTTDIHETWQAEMVAEYVDIIQIPAFLCRQTDLLLAAGDTGKIVNIKKGQWVSPDSVKHWPSKVGHDRVWITERGTSFGYSQLLVDFGAVDLMREGFQKVVLDCTHATQRKKGEFTGGDRELAAKYMLAAPIFGYDGIFAETHPNPAAAVSDADCQIELNKLDELLRLYDGIRTTLGA